MRLRKYSLLIATLLLSNILATSANIVVKTSLDSAYLIMGKQTRLHVSVVGSLPDSCNVNVVDTAWSNVEIAGISEPKINDLGNNRKELLQDVIIQSFDSGMYTLPPVYFINGGETIASNRPVLKVLPVAVDSMLTVHDYTDVVDIKRHFLDYFPDWVTDYGLWILLALIVIGGSVFVYFKWLKKGKLPLVPTKKPYLHINLPWNSCNCFMTSIYVKKARRKNTIRGLLIFSVRILMPDLESTPWK